MVLIISNEADYSTNIVINWLHFFNVSFVRINQEDEINVQFKGSDFLFTVNNISFLLSELKCSWYRRGFLNFKIDKIGDAKIDQYRKEEIIKIKDFIYYKISLLKNINDFKNSDVNKLIVNDLAKKAVLKTPNDYLIDSKGELEKIKSNKIMSTKSIAGSAMFFYDKFYFVSYTKIIKNLTQTPISFFPSLVQDYIKKKYELRIFFIDDLFWSMAIFSQLDSQTKVDFRNYNNDNPNRNVPFLLPHSIQKKLLKLMKKLRLNSGSIDMIVTESNEYVFLEVNPIGQFGMVSNPCNYYLHMKIASILKAYDNE